MAPYTARTGGIFGSGLYPDSRPRIDVGGAIDSVTRGATSLIQNAYERRLADQQRQIQADERTRQHTREDTLDKRAGEEFQMRKDEHDAQMAASGYTPAHQETTSAVVPGEVKSEGLGGKNSITGPKVTEKTQTVRGAYDYRKSAGYQVASDTRGRKALEFATVYKKNFPNATDEEALQAGQYAADNPSIADNILFPRQDPTVIHATNRQTDINNPLPPRRTTAGSSNSPIGKALTTAKQRVDRNARDRGQAQARFRGMHPGVNSLEDAGSAQDSTDFRRFQSADSAYNAEGTRFRATQDSLATRQLRENGLTPRTDSTKPAKQTPAPNSAAEETRLRALAKQAIDNGADPAAVTQRLNQQLAAARKKK